MGLLKEAVEKEKKSRYQAILDYGRAARIHQANSPTLLHSIRNRKKGTSRYQAFLQANREGWKHYQKRPTLLHSISHRNDK